MIPLQKMPLADDLSERLRERAERYADLAARNEPIPDSIMNAYRARAIKISLKAETHDKCAYCESKVPHIDHGDVEHIVPKALRPDLRFEYSNLTFACTVCNNRKGDYFDDVAPLLNPYIDIPEVYLQAFGPMIVGRRGNQRGLVTQMRLDLNRIELCERRKDRLQQIHMLMERELTAENPGVRRVLAEQLLEECGADKEYSLVVKSFIEHSRA